MTGQNSRRRTVSLSDLAQTSERLKAGDTLRQLAGSMGLSVFCLRARLIEANLYPDFSRDRESGWHCPQCRREAEQAEGAELCIRCAAKHHRLKPRSAATKAANSNSKDKMPGFNPLSQKFLMMRLVP